MNLGWFHRPTEALSSKARPCQKGYEDVVKENIMGREYQWKLHKFLYEQNRTSCKREDFFPPIHPSLCSIPILHPMSFSCPRPPVLKSSAGSSVLEREVFSAWHRKVEVPVAMFSECKLIPQGDFSLHGQNSALKGSL